jgi:hypothetical protein
MEALRAGAKSDNESLNVTLTLARFVEWKAIQSIT